MGTKLSEEVKFSFGSLVERAEAEETVTVNLSSVIQEIEIEDDALIDWRNFTNDSFSRDFLSLHVNEEIALEGKFRNKGKYKGSALFHNCTMHEDWSRYTFVLGHMWWQNFTDKLNGKLKRGEIVRVFGKIYHYKNKEGKDTYGIDVYKILEIRPDIQSNKSTLINLVEI